MKTFNIYLLSVLFAVSHAADDNALTFIPGPQRCDANPLCSGLVDTCCPTSYHGIFLDCCEKPNAACNVNPGCAGLVEDCCPTKDGKFLACCFEPDPAEAKYRLKDYLFADQNTGRGDRWSYFLSTGKAVKRGQDTLPNTLNIYNYERNPDHLYDLIYFKGSVPGVDQYLTGQKKFRMYIGQATTAPKCTQIILQLDNLPGADNDNYPAGRHSRFIGTIGEYGIVEFDFLDRPDPSVSDNDVNAIVLLFDPGHYTGDNYEFFNIDGYELCEPGRESGCTAVTKSCPVEYMQQEGDAEPACTECGNPACTNVNQCSVVTSFEALAPNSGFSRTTSSAQSTASSGTMVLLAILSLLGFLATSV